MRGKQTEPHVAHCLVKIRYSSVTAPLDVEKSDLAGSYDHRVGPSRCSSSETINVLGNEKPSDN